MVDFVGNVNGLRYRDILQEHMVPWARQPLGRIVSFKRTMLFLIELA